MNDERPTDDLRDFWQNQDVPPFRMSSDEIRKGIEQLDRCLRRATMASYTCAFLAIAGTILWLFAFPNLIQRIGSMLTALGAGYIIYQIRLSQLLKRSAEVAAARMGNTASVELYRAELQQRHDFHSGIWLWSRLIIFAPGPLIFIIGDQVAHPGKIHNYAVIAVYFAVLAMGVYLQRREASRIQSEIKEVERLQSDQS
jgi:hypothetical protein